MKQNEKINPLKRKRASMSNNPPEGGVHQIMKPQAFLIRSIVKKDIINAKKYRVWGSTVKNNAMFKTLFLNKGPKGEIILLFCDWEKENKINQANRKDRWFVGAARMLGVPKDTLPRPWTHKKSWGSSFRIEWLSERNIEIIPNLRRMGMKDGTPFTPELNAKYLKEYGIHVEPPTLLDKYFISAKKPSTKS